MTCGRQTVQTVLRGAHLGSEGVISYTNLSGREVYLIYSVAQQAMLGKRFAQRYLGKGIDGPFAEYVDIDSLSSPVGDPIAERAMEWLVRSARETPDGATVWLHEFDLVYTNYDRPVYPPWLSAIGQANALLACIHWWRHTSEARWKELVYRAVIPFQHLFNTESGVSLPLGEDEAWFEEYPTIPPSHILNCHLLSLVALDYACRTFVLPEAEKAFSKGWNALKRRINLYDRQDWSRYDLSNRLFLFIRLIPSPQGNVTLGKADLLTANGLRICRLEAGGEEARDNPVSRLAGIDWGLITEIDGRRGRVVPNCADSYSSGIPEGGTDQNTYIIFEEDISPDWWAEHGLLLNMEVFLEDGAELILQFQDPRFDALVFREDPVVVPVRGDGWVEASALIPPRLVGRVLPRSYHRFQTELLGTLVTKHPDPGLTEVFERWHRSDLFDVITVQSPPPLKPATVFVFVNSKCNLHCKMCDVGSKNEEATLTHHLTGAMRDLDPEILVRAMNEVGDGPTGLNLEFTGTEPLIWPDYPEVLNCAKNLSVQTGITTNGLLLSREAYRLAETRLDHITLSIDGPPAIHDEIRGVKGLFSKVGNGLEALRRECHNFHIQEPRLFISLTISYWNHKRILDFFESVRPMRPEAVYLSHLNFVTPEIAALHNSLFPQHPIGSSAETAWRKSLKMDFLELFFQLEEARRISWTEVHIIPYCPTPTRLKWYYTRPELPMSRDICAAPWSCIQVRADGSVAVLGRCFDIHMGHLAGQSVEEIWTGKAYEEFRTFTMTHPWLPACLRCCGSL